VIGSRAGGSRCLRLEACSVLADVGRFSSSFFLVVEADFRDGF
jgi:hypothetical protein